MTVDYKISYYSPEDILSAIKEDRLIILPVPIGSTVYAVKDRCHAPYYECPYDGGRGGLDRCTKDGSKCKAYYYETEFTLPDLNYIGVTVFLTREEAAAAVERMNRNNGQ